MPWFLLVVAGLLEVCWAVGLARSDGLTRPGPTLFTAVTLLGSMWLLSLATRTIPLGTAYPMWVGIGALGTALAGAWLHGEPLTPARVGFLLLLVVSLAGLRITALSEAAADG